MTRDIWPRAVAGPRVEKKKKKKKKKKKTNKLTFRAQQPTPSLRFADLPSRLLQIISHQSRSSRKEILCPLTAIIYYELFFDIKFM